MNHNLTHCTNETCPRRDHCLRAVAWQAIRSNKQAARLVRTINGEHCQQRDYDVYRPYVPQTTKP